MSDETKTIPEEIAAERQRQIWVKGHTLTGDDKNQMFELVDKTEERILRARETIGTPDYRRHLIEAAALLAAEVERHDRSLRPLHLFRVDDAERFWIVARDEEDAAEVFSMDIDWLGEAEKLALQDKMARIADAAPVTIYDGSARSTKTADQWALNGRGVLAATCE